MEGKLFHVWVEGYRITGNSNTARFLGVAQGNTFLEACQAVAKKNNMLQDYNPLRNTYWGCCLFDNETDARKAFG